MKRSTLLRFVKRAADESGAAAVEFAIVSSVFLTFVFGIIYAAMMLQSNTGLQWAVESTIRDAALNPNVTQTQLTTTLNSYLATSALPNAASVNYSTAVVGGVTVATLQASFTRSFTIPFVGTFTNAYTAIAKTPQNSPPSP